MSRVAATVTALALAATTTTLAPSASAQQGPAPAAIPSPAVAAAPVTSAPAAPPAPIATPAPVVPPTQPVQATLPAPVAPGPTYPSQPAPPYGYAPTPYGYPPQAYPAPGAGPGGFIPLPPPTLDYVAGQPVPPGYRVHTKTQTKLAIAGGSIFGGSYLLSVGGASVDSGNQRSSPLLPLVIPVAGPFITIASAGSRDAATLLLVLDGLAQTSGVLMFIIGLASEDTVLLRNDLRAAAPEIPEIDVGPGAASARWRF